MSCWTEAPHGAPALAGGVARLGTESAFSVLARARELEAAGRDIVHLEIGEPDFDTPAHVSEAGGRGHPGRRRPTTARRRAAGVPRRDRGGLHARAGSPSTPSSVLVGNGAKPFLFFTILAVCEPGDEVVYPDPGFPIYESAIRWAGGTPVPLPLHEAADFSFDLDELRRGSATARSS